MSTTEKVLIIHGAGPHAKGDTLIPFVNSFLKYLRIKRLKAPSTRDYIVKDKHVSEDKDGKLKSVLVKLQQAGDPPTEKILHFQEGYWSDAYVPHTVGHIAQWSWDWAKTITEGNTRKTAKDWKQKRKLRAEEKDWNRGVNREILRARQPFLKSLFNLYERLEKWVERGLEKLFAWVSGKGMQYRLRWAFLAYFGWIFYRLLSWGAITILLMLRVPSTGNIWKYADWFVLASGVMGGYLFVFGSGIIDAAAKRTSRFVRFLRGLFTISIGWLGLPVVLFALGAHLLGVTFYIVVLLAWIACWQFIYPSSSLYFGLDGRIFWAAIAALAFLAWLLIPPDFAKKYKGNYYAILADLAIPIGIPVAAFLFKLVLFLSIIPFVGEYLSGWVATLSDKMIVSFVGDVELYLEDEVQATRILENVEDSAQSLIDSNEINNDRVDQVHIVAHSLGSVIAYEALTKKDVFSQEVQDKVVTLITMGSPLDKINYLLEGQRDRFPRFEFVESGFPSPLMWVNLYALRDLVADRFEFIPGPHLQFSVATDANIFAAHSAYWGDVRTMGYIVWAILYKDEKPLDLQDIEQKRLQEFAQVGVVTVEDLLAQEWETLNKNTTLTQEQFINLQKKLGFTKIADVPMRVAGILSSTGLSQEGIEAALQGEEDKEFISEIQNAHIKIVRSLDDGTIDNLRGREKSQFKW